MLRVRKTQLHQWNEALAAGKQFGLIAKLGKHRRRFQQRTCAMIMERSWVHLYSLNAIQIDREQDRADYQTISRSLPGGYRIWYRYTPNSEPLPRSLLPRKFGASFVTQAYNRIRSGGDGFSHSLISG